MSRPRVLCLHGWRTNAAFMTLQLRMLGSEFQRLFELRPINAPMEALGDAPDDCLAMGIAGPYYQWWNHTDGQYLGFEDTLDYVCRLLRENHPVDGLLGFSQGAVLSLILLGMKSQGDPRLADIPLRFGICYAGFMPLDLSLHRYLPTRETAQPGQSLLTMPVVHVAGQADAIAHPEEVALASDPDRVLVLHHRRGHVMTMLDKGQMEQLRQFLTAHGVPLPEPVPAPA
eukprot:EG_transcript_22485